MDLSLRVIACDRGAAAILNRANQPKAQAGHVPRLPEELVDMLRRREFADHAPSRGCIRIGHSEYVCRAYLVEGNGGRLTESIVALHLERDLSASEAASEAGVRYQLTGRELEALEGILMGLGNKEVAERMNISPNTVKAFLHLIMIKMGVATRAGIVVKVLHNRDNRGTLEKSGDMPDGAARRLVLDAVAANAVAVGSSTPTASGGQWHKLIGEVGEDALAQPARNSLPFRIRQGIDEKEGS